VTRIHTIDLDYLGTAGAVAVYVLETDDGPVMIESGPASTTAALERGLAAIGMAPGDVRRVLVTHIHFDHAGAAGWMAGHGAQIHVHEFGARHLADPTRLVKSATRIYGDEMERRWGVIEPVPEEQVSAMHDGDVLEVGGVRIRTVETPGHARHHHAFAVELPDGKVAFTGDAAASYVFDAPGFVSLPTPPPEFELGAWLATVRRLEDERFDRIYPTHFGPVDDPAAHLGRVRAALRAHADYVRNLMDEGLADAAMRERYTAWFLDQARSAGVPEGKIPFYVTDTVADMNLTGITRYWTKLRSA
jgi:glyoxylase-like metal-dependent hydrolase (beta-lactamase superfamily II)